jgi:hypothetical protein
MPDTSTEVAIATTTLGSTATNITFSSISSAYTDLRIVFTGTSTGNAGFLVRFNGDSATNYSQTNLIGDGSAAASNASSSSSSFDFSINNNMGTTPVFFYSLDIFSYSGSTFKTSLMQQNHDNNGSGSVVRNVGLYRSTSAITSIALSVSANNFSIGSTATLYGIL